MADIKNDLQKSLFLHHQQLVDSAKSEVESIEERIQIAKEQLTSLIDSIGGNIDLAAPRKKRDIEDLRKTIKEQEAILRRANEHYRKVVSEARKATGKTTNPTAKGMLRRTSIMDEKLTNKASSFVNVQFGKNFRDTRSLINEYDEIKNVTNSGSAQEREAASWLMEGLKEQIKQSQNNVRQSAIVIKAFKKSLSDINESSHIMADFTGGWTSWWAQKKQIDKDAELFNLSFGDKWWKIMFAGAKTFWKTSEKYFYDTLKSWKDTLLEIFKPVTRVIQFTTGAIAAASSGLMWVIRKTFDIKKDTRSEVEKRLDVLIGYAKQMAKAQDEALDIQRDDWKAKLRAGAEKGAKSLGWAALGALGIGAGILMGRLLAPFKILSDLMPKTIAPIGKAIKSIFGKFTWISKAFSGVAKILSPFMGIIGKVISAFKFGFTKLFYPIQVVLSIFDFVEGWSKTEGNIFQKFVGGLESVVLGIVEWPIKFFGAIVDWLAKQMGFENLNIADKLIGGIQSIFDFIKHPIDSVKKFFGIKSDTETGITAARTTAENAYKFDRQKDREQMRELTKTTKAAGADSANAVATAIAAGQTGSSNDSGSRTNEASLPSYPETLTAILGGMAF